MRAFTLHRLRPLGLALSLALAYPVVQGLPQGAQVVNGQVKVQPGLIQQGSDKAIVNWQSFSIAAGETLRIQQPGVNAVLLNRVVGGDPSLILGQMQANGRVFLLNPHGIVFGRGSQVDVGGLVASTLDLSDTAFLAGAYRFSAGPAAGSLQADGSIQAPGGTVALVAPQLSVGGSIAARRVGVAAASTVQVDVEGDGLVLFNLRTDDDRDIALKFNGQLRAEGSAELRAQARGGAAGQVLNMDGIVQARGLSQQGGRIVIDGGTAGVTQVNGRLDAAGEQGGNITVLGRQLALLDGARLDASGRLGGGSLQVGGGFHGQGTAHNAEQTWIAAGAQLRADATEQGDGGRIAIWADGRTDFYGSAWARGGRLGGDGGQVETSGAQRLNLLGSVDASAPHGRAGQWLLDPNDVTIKSNGGNNVNVGAAPNFSSTDDSAIVDVGALNAALTGGTSVTVQTTNGGAGTESGNIDVRAAITPAGAATLNLVALGNISFSGAGKIDAGPAALNVSLQAAGSITGSSINTGGGTLAATSTGGGTVALGSVTSAGLSIDSGGGAVTLPSGSVNGALSVSSGGGTVTQAGGLVVTGTTGVSAGAGNITLTASGNDLQGAVSLTTTGISQVSNASGKALTLGTLSTHDLTVSASGANLDLGSGTVTGALSATTTGTGTLTQTGALTVTGTTGLSSASGNITLTAANDLRGRVSITSGGSTQIANGSGKDLLLGALNAAALSVSTTAAALDLGSGSVAGTLSATTTGTGTLTQSGALTVTGAATLSSGSGGITLVSGNDLQGAVSVTSTGTTQLANASGKALTLGVLNTHDLTVNATAANLDLGSGSVTGQLHAATTGAGTLTQTGALTVSGVTVLAAGSGAITLAAANNLQGAVDLTTTGAAQIVNGAGNALALGTLNTGALTVSTSGANLDLGQGTVNGALSATTTGAGTLTQSGALTVTGTAALASGNGDITLTAANDLRGAVSISSGGSTQLANANGNALTLGTLNTAALTVSTTHADLNLGSGSVLGAFSASTTGTGTITQAGALTVSGATTLSNASGDITLVSANDFQGAVGITTTGTTQLANGSGKALTLGSLSTRALTVSTTAADLDLGSGSITGTLSASTSGSGALTQTGALTVTGTTSLSNGSGAISLTAANDLRGAVSVTSTGSAQIVNGSGNDLALGTLNAGALTVSTSNADIDLGSGTVAGALSATTTGTGKLTQTGALTVTGSSSLANGSGDITLLNSGNDLQGAVSLTTTGTTQLANGSGHALTLGTLNVHGLTVSTSNAGLDLGQGTVTGNLSATTSAAGAISQSGALTVTGTTGLANGSGSITLTAANNLQGAVGITTTGATQLANDSGNALTLGTLDTHDLSVSTANANLRLGSGSVAGNLVATTSGGGTLTQSGALTVTGTTSLVNGSGDITLVSANDLQGAVSITSTGTTRVGNGGSHALTLGTLSTNDLVVSTAGGALNLGQGNITGTLNASSQGGAITQTGALTVSGVATLDATTTGDISLPNTANQWHGLNLVGNSLDLRSAGDLEILSLTQPANRALTLAAGGDLILGPVASINTGSADLTLTSGGSFTMGGVLAGHNVQLQAQTGLVLGQNITATGTLTLTTASGDINQTGGRLQVDGATTVSAGSSAIILNQPANHFAAAVSLSGGSTGITDNAALTLGTLATGDLTVTSNGALNLGQGTVNGTLSATSTGHAITQTGGLTLVGATTLDAGGADITLNQAGNDLQGAITATSGAVSLRSASDLNLFALTQTPNKGLELEAGGTLLLPAGTSNIDTGTEALTLSSGGVFATFGTLKGGAVTLKGQSATLGHDITATGALVVTATGGAIDQTGGRIVAAGSSSFDAGGQPISLTSASNQFGGTVALTGGDTQLHNAGALALGAGSITGTLAITAAGAITQAAGPLSVSGAASFDAQGADISLTDLTNTWGGSVALAGRNLVFQGGSAVTLGPVNGTTLSLTAGGAVSQVGGTALTLGGLSVDAGSAAITLANGGNQLGGTVALKGGVTQLQTSGALTLGTLDTADLNVTAHGALRLGSGSVAGNLVATSNNGALTQAVGGLSVTGTAALDAGTADITLTDAVNAWSGAVGLTGRDASLTGSGALALGAVNVRALVLQAGGAVTQSSPLSLTGALTVDAGSAAITLDDAANSLGGLVTLTGGVTQVRTTGGLTLGALSTGDLDVRASGAMNLGQGHVGGDLVAQSGNGAISQSGALKVTGAASFNSGTGNITLANSGNQFLGALSLTGNAVTIFNQPSLSFGTLSFNTLDATSNGSIALGSGTLSGALTAKALGGDITQIAGGLTVAGNVTLQASTGITLTDAANHLNGTVSLSGGASAITNAGPLRLGTLATAGLTLNVTGTLNLGSGTVGGALAATSTGAISQTGALSVTGTSNLNAGSAGITLGQAGNAFTGSVDLHGGATLVTATGALNLGNLSVSGLTASSTGGLRLGAGAVSGNLDANSGGGITQAAGGLNVSGTATLQTGGNINLPAANGFAGAVHVIGSDITLVNAGGLHLAAFSAHDLKVSAGGDLDLGGGTVGGELTATTRGATISQSGAMTVTGLADFVADGSLATLVLDQPGNQLLGGISMRGINGGSFASANISSAQDLTFSGDVQTLTLNSGGVLTLGGGHSTTLTAGASKGIVLTGPLDVSGLMTLIANGGVGMSVDMASRATGNDFNRVELQAKAGGSFGRVQLRDDDAARHDGLKLSGDAGQLEVTSVGALEFGGGSYGGLLADTSASGAGITQTGALIVTGLTTLKAGGGDITLNRTDNQFAGIAIDGAGTASLASAGNYTIDASNVSRRLELAGAGAISLAGPLTGTGELVMKGTGSLTVTGPQGYSGGTRIETGTLVLQGPTAEAGSGAVQLGVGGQLDLRDGASLAAELVAQGGKVLNTSGSGTLAGPVTLQAFTRFEPGAGGLTISGAIDDGGAGFGLGLVGSGTLTLSGSNRYSGITDIASGTLRAAGDGSLSAASAVQLAAGAVLSLGADQAAGSLRGAGHVELDRFTLGTGLDGRDTEFSGSLTGTGGLTKLGAGRFTLSGNGAHTGATRVSAGELVLASATALNATTAVTVEDAATLTVQQSLDLGSLAGGGTVDLQADLLGVGSNGSSTRWDGSIVGRGGLAKRGAGIFTLAGHNTLAGDLQVEAGTLQLQGSGVRALAVGAATGPVVPATAGVDVATGATLELLTDIDLGALTGTGQVQLNAYTLGIGASGRSGRFDGVIAGTGGLTKAGSGTLTLGGGNLYTGATLARGGTLVLDAAQALAAASILTLEAPARVEVKARQAVASLSGTGELVLNGAALAAGADGVDSRFDGQISGSGGLVKQGAGTLTLTAANTHSGTTLIEAGTLKLAGQGSLGSGEIQNQGQLLLARDDAFTLAQAISGAGSLVVSQGQVTLASTANRYSGATQVQGGSLITAAADILPDASAVQVAAGAQLQLGGNETIASLQAAGSVRLAGNLTTAGEQVYTGSLTLANAAGITLTGSLIDASASSNQFSGATLGLSGGQAKLTVKDSLQLGDVTLTGGGRIEADRLALNGKLQLGGGTLELVATAAPDDAKATLLGTAQLPVAGVALAVAEATVTQGSSSAITVADGARLAVQASGGGSVVLAQDANDFKGQLSVLSGAAFNTAWTPNAKGNQGVQSLVHVAGQQVMVGGSGIEADLVHIRADQLATADGAKLVARLPFDEIVLGKSLSAPGMTLELAPGAFGLGGSFGAVNGRGIEVEVGSMDTGGRTTGPNAGYLTVLPKAGVQGSTAIVLVGPKVGSTPAGGGPGYRFFHDGASQAAEIPVVYNGVLPLTPAASGALSSINGDAEDARRARFQETVRTENVTVRLRSGVIAEVGPGRASTQGSEGARLPDTCDPAAQPVLSCKSSTP